MTAVSGQVEKKTIRSNHKYLLTRFFGMCYFEASRWSYTSNKILIKCFYLLTLFADKFFWNIRKRKHYRPKRWILQQMVRKKVISPSCWVPFSVSFFFGFMMPIRPVRLIFQVSSGRMILSSKIPLYRFHQWENPNFQHISSHNSPYTWNQEAEQLYIMFIFACIEIPGSRIGLLFSLVYPTDIVRKHTGLVDSHLMRMISDRIKTKVFLVWLKYQFLNDLYKEYNISDYNPRRKLSNFRWLLNIGPSSI